MEIKVSETLASRVALSATSKPRPRALSAVRFQTFASCPSPARRCAIAAPILPVPAMPIFITRYLLFESPLSSPGQYFDRETITHYNMMRDYAPAIGRYQQSDPIGLRAGLN